MLRPYAVTTTIFGIKIGYPNNNILIYKDDVHSSFLRYCYHPDIVTAYTYILGKWLVIPIDLIFERNHALG